MEAIGQLTGGVAHDFNNLLAVVLGNLDMAKKRLPPDPKLQQLIDNSIQAADRGATLTRRMLAFARRQQLEARSVDVIELVRDMSDMLQRSIGPSVQISTQFPLRLAPAFADSNQLELALLNLVVNARDAMPEGGAIIISARQEQVTEGGTARLAPGEYVCLLVADTGMGMDAETLDRAVQPFFTTKGVGKGTGLGLSMIHGFAEQSGGSLVLKSTPGQGTVAEIWLPASSGLDDVEEAPVEEPAPRMTANAMRILVVDDDNLVLMNTTAMLEDLGHEVVEATSGEQALRILRRTSMIDVVLTDELMPGMKGTQLIAAVKAEFSGIPAILATGFAELQAELPAGTVRIDKPFSRAVLESALEAATQSRTGVVPFPSGRRQGSQR
jgi:CheY-like chemotaxis protein